MFSAANGSLRQGWPWAEVSSASPSDMLNAMNLPKISIVTPSFNQGAFIEEAILSVLRQEYPNLEYIIMDGGSTDHTVEVIKKYADRISFWASEKDRGQSHAINKGIARCSGDIFNWINSDDMLMPGALWKVAAAWMRKPGCMVSGAGEAFNEGGTVHFGKAQNQTLKNFVRFWEAADFGWGQIPTFVPLKELTAIGGVREDLHFCMDYYMMVKLLMRGVEVIYVEDTLGAFRLHGESKTVGSKEDFRLELVPALRSIVDLPVKVAAWEWDAQQAMRLVDVARHAWVRGSYIRAMDFLRRALFTSLCGTIQEVWKRSTGRLVRCVHHS